MWPMQVLVLLPFSEILGCYNLVYSFQLLLEIAGDPPSRRPHGGEGRGTPRTQPGGQGRAPQTPSPQTLAPRMLADGL